LAGGTLWAGPLAIFRTPLGDIEVELYEDKPVTTQNFLRYVSSGAYSNMFFHRWMPGFVMQGGGFETTNRSGASPGISSLATIYGSITNEFGVGRRASNVYGTLAMAKIGGDPNSASSQWFFNLADNSANLDNQNGGFTVFARVLRGTNVLERFNDVSATHSLWMVDLKTAFGGALTQLPVLTTNAYYEDLVYCNVTALQLQARPATNRAGVELSWPSVINLTNVVEFRDHLTQAWAALVRTNGNGQTMRLTDQPPGGARYYRVRVEY
jgi:cyclophilin family peptidyl-prolyl cis-trans isomerase